MTPSYAGGQAGRVKRTPSSRASQRCTLANPPTSHRHPSSNPAPTRMGRVMMPTNTPPNSSPKITAPSGNAIRMYSKARTVRRRSTSGMVPSRGVTCPSSRAVMLTIMR